jgi:hypothetical protein
MAEIERLLSDDAILEMAGTATWFSGKETCVPFIAAQAIGQAGDWRMVPLLANGQLAVAAYHLDDDRYHPFAIVVLATTLPSPHPHLALRRARTVQPLRTTPRTLSLTQTRDGQLTSAHETDPLRHLNAPVGGARPWPPYARIRGQRAASVRPPAALGAASI